MTIHEFIQDAQHTGQTISAVIRQTNTIQPVGIIKDNVYTGIADENITEIESVTKDVITNIMIKPDSITTYKPVLLYQVFTTGIDINSTMAIAIVESEFYQEYNRLPTEEDVGYPESPELPYSYYREIQNALADHYTHEYKDGILVTTTPKPAVRILKDYGFEVFPSPVELVAPRSVADPRFKVHVIQTTQALYEKVKHCIKDNMDQGFITESDTSKLVKRLQDLEINHNVQVIKMYLDENTDKCFVIASICGHILQISYAPGFTTELIEEDLTKEIQNGIDIYEYLFIPNTDILTLRETGFIKRLYQNINITSIDPDNPCVLLYLLLTELHIIEI